FYLGASFIDISNRQIETSLQPGKINP
ncbi:hypothetical protein ABIA35_008474, partial [Catenulispora sp. MAP12-49]